MIECTNRFLAYSYAIEASQAEAVKLGMADFMAWIGARWREWDAGGRGGKYAAQGRSDAEHDDFDAWLIRQYAPGGQIMTAQEAS
jgi:hypothetical protein